MWHKPIVVFVPPGGLLGRFVYMLGWYKEQQVNFFDIETGPATVVVRVSSKLMPEIVSEGGLYAMEAQAKFSLVARFRHNGKWYMMCNKSDWESLCSAFKELRSASPEEIAEKMLRYIEDISSGHFKNDA